MQFLSKVFFLFIPTLLTIYFGVSIAEDCNVPSKTITVDKSSGSGNFNTVQRAIDSVPEENGQWIKIHIKPGTYIEKVTIPENKPCIFLEGEGYSNTKITYNAHETTDTSSTFCSYANHIVAKGITFENSYNLKGSTRYSDIKQAVAASIYGDKSAFFDCSFIGVQDTLWDVQGLHYFKNCYIEGAIDFIFGRGQSVYEDCSINSTAGSLGFAGFITAQGRSSSNDRSGFVFRRGSVSGSGQVYLGRAYGAYSRVIFHQTWLSSVVTPSGWDSWFHPDNVGNFTYAEVSCTGPGSNTSKRVWWEKKLDYDKLDQFSTSLFVNKDGWLHHLPK